MTPLKLSRVEAKEIFKWTQEHKESDFEMFVQHFCHDLTMYQDFVVLVMSYNAYYGGEWKSCELMSRMQYDCILENPSTTVGLGEINGKHSNVRESISGLIDRVITDPEEIALMVEKGKIDMDEFVETFLFDDYESVGELKEALQEKRKKKKKKKRKTKNITLH